MNQPGGRANDGWPDPAVRAAARGRRRHLFRVALLLIVGVGAIWASGALGLLDARGIALVVGAALALSFVHRVSAREAAGRPGPFTLAMAEHRSSPVSNRLTELERSLDLATISAGDAHHTLRPLVIDVAGEWLRGAHGIDLEDRRAEALLPSDVWALASPEARRPTDPHAAGVTPAELGVLIAHLEALR